MQIGTMIHKMMDDWLCCAVCAAQFCQHCLTPTTCTSTGCQYRYAYNSLTQQCGCKRIIMFILLYYYITDLVNFVCVCVCVRVCARALCLCECTRCKILNFSILFFFHNVRIQVYNLDVTKRHV